MARTKMLAHRVTLATAWIAIAAATLGIAYEGSAAVAHAGTFVPWR